MNTLSLLLYLSDLFESASDLLTALSFAFIIAWGGWGVVFLVEEGNVSKPKVWLLWVGIISATLTVLLPEQRTFYLIMASELGESAWKSDVGQEIYDDLRTILDLQIERLKGE